MENISEYVGKKIKEYRKKKRLTQEELGKRIGVGLSTISGYERGSSSPDNEKLFALSKVLDVSVNDFFPEANDGNILDHTEKFNFPVSVKDLAFLQELATDLQSKSGEERERYLESIRIAINVHKYNSESK